MAKTPFFTRRHTFWVSGWLDDFTPFGYEVRGLSYLQRLGSTSAQTKLKAIKNVGHFGGTIGSAFDKTFFSQLRQGLEA